MIDITQEEIMKNWGVDNSDNPLVSVKCMAYNQEKYIAQCIEGFLIQKTTFPFEVLIHDDCSTDNTTKIIQDYANKFPKIIKPIFEEENQYSKGIPFGHHKKIDMAIKGKYITICEGDDYWTDSAKLQNQVTFLENHNDYGMIYAKVRSYYQDSNTFGKNIGKKAKKIEELIKKGNYIPTQSICFRYSLYFDYFKDIEPENKGWKMGDYPFNLWLAQNTKIFFQNKVIGVYRILSESTSHSKNIDFLLKFAKSTNDVISYFKLKYQINCKTPNHETIILFNDALAKNDRDGVIKYAKFDELFRCSFLTHLKVFVFKNNFLYNLYRKYKKLG